VSTYESRINEFKERIASIGKTLTDLTTRRKSYSLAAASGDAQAIKEIADIDFALDEAKREEGTLSSAIETAAALERQQQQDIEAQARRERAVAAYKVSRAVIALNEELDMRLAQLREAFERRASLLVELGNTEMVDRTVVMKLAGRTGATASAHSAGLGRFMSLDHMPVVSHRPLADSNSQLLGIGEAPDDKAKAAPRTNTRH
jgi:hypothetical protein